MRIVNLPLVTLFKVSNQTLSDKTFPILTLRTQGLEGLNICVLGATSATYFVDYYGPMPGINAGLPSDRILAHWQLDAPGVVARAEKRPCPPRADLSPVAIPRDIDALIASDPQAALAERLSLRAALQSAIAKGQAIVGFDRTQVAYLLGTG
ncbi:hypothetical protein [Celeribacter sp.]|uniref:hypothetical protein n=1 Tax=Celeribacter sp. TaxID=1890673 RepID=UPI003A933C55